MKYPIEFIANGEQQITAKLEPEQIATITNYIYDMISDNKYKLEYLLEKQEVAGLDKAEQYELETLLNERSK